MSGDFSYNTAVGNGYGPTMVEYSVDPAAGAVAAVMGGILLVMMLFGLVFYIYFAYCLMRIAKKTGTANGWFAWIPILNIVLMVQVANKPIWWLLMFFVPVINIVFTILIWMEIAKRVGKPEWWGVLIIVPFVNLVVPGYLAFSEAEISQSSGQQAQEQNGSNVKQEQSDAVQDQEGGNQG